MTPRDIHVKSKHGKVNLVYNHTECRSELTVITKDNNAAFYITGKQEVGTRTPPSSFFAANSLTSDE